MKQSNASGRGWMVPDRHSSFSKKSLGSNDFRELMMADASFGKACQSGFFKTVREDHQTKVICPQKIREFLKRVKLREGSQEKKREANELERMSSNHELEPRGSQRVLGRPSTNRGRRGNDYSGSRGNIERSKEGSGVMSSRGLKREEATEADGSSRYYTRTRYSSNKAIPIQKGRVEMFQKRDPVSTSGPQDFLSKISNCIVQLQNNSQGNLASQVSVRGKEKSTEKLASFFRARKDSPKKPETKLVIPSIEAENDQLRAQIKSLQEKLKEETVARDYWQEKYKDLEKRYDELIFSQVQNRGERASEVSTKPAIFSTTNKTPRPTSSIKTPSSFAVQMPSGNPRLKSPSSKPDKESNRKTVMDTNHSTVARTDRWDTLYSSGN